MTLKEPIRSSPSKPQGDIKRAGGISKNILNFDSNNSYIEEEDSTFLSTETSTLSEEFLESSSIEDTDGISTYNNTEEEVEDESIAGKIDLPSQAREREKRSEEIAVPKPSSNIRKFIMKHEIPRKGLHSSIGFISLWLYTLGVGPKDLIAPLSTLFAVMFASDFARLRYPEINKIFVKYMWVMMREKEVNSYNGVLFYLAGLILVFSLFPKDICLLSILLLSWADTAASTFGRLYGKYTPKLTRNKSLAGSLASFVTGVVSCYLVYKYYIPVYNDKVNSAEDIMWRPDSRRINIHTYAFFTGLIASFSEMIDLYTLDDNFTIPVISSSFIYCLLKLFKA